MYTDMLVRFGMNGVLVLAMLPGILCGIERLNFGLPIGYIGRNIGRRLVSIELNLRGGIAFFVA